MEQKKKSQIPSLVLAIWPIKLVSTRDWSPKFATGLNMIIGCSIWVTRLLFCQIDSPMGQSLWQKDRMVTHILFDLCIFKHFSQVANFGDQSLLSINYINCETFSTKNWDMFKTPDTCKITIWGQGSKLSPNRQKTFFA